MTESAFTSKFNKWIKHVYCKTGAFEIKQTPNPSLPYSAVVPHQINALLQAKHGTLVFKIPDAGYQNPFDVFSLAFVPAYVVIKFTKHWYAIDIDLFIHARDTSNRKSITELEASKIAAFTSHDY